MKTTIDIADELINRAKTIQRRDQVTLRALVEEGLRVVIEQRSKPRKYRFEPVVVGPTRIDHTMTPKKINRFINEARERPSLLRSFPEATGDELTEYRSAKKHEAVPRNRRSADSKRGA